MTSPFHRFAMVAIATTPFAAFRTSTIEVDALQKRYTVETLEQMGQMYPGADLLFIVGTDMYQEIESWKNFERLFDLAQLVIVNRPGYPFREDVAPFIRVEPDEQVELSGTKSVFYLSFVEQPISSTEVRLQIREARRRGEALTQPWLPPEVWSYIEKNKLYV